METPQAVVLHSGGQDSSTCLAWAVEKFGRDHVFPVSFAYGQKHSVELECAMSFCDHLGVKHPVVLPVEALQVLGGAALTDPEHVEVSSDATGTGNVFAEKHGLPSTFVPGRNLLFFTLAMAYGAKVGAYNLVTGICEADEAGYPDCRQEFAVKAQDALAAALDEKITVWAPLLDKSKAETFKLAEELGVLPAVVRLTHTCYNGVHDQLHLWGYGCGECPACLERIKGWDQFQADPERERVAAMGD